MSNKISYDAVKELSKTKVGNFLYGVAASIIVVMGWFGLVDDETAKIASDARLQLQQEKIELLKETRDIAQQILESPDVPAKYISLVAETASTWERSNIMTQNTWDAITRICSPAQIKEIEQYMEENRDLLVQMADVNRISNMNPALKEKTQKLSLEIEFKELAEVNALLKEAELTYQDIKDKKGPEFYEVLMKLQELSTDTIHHAELVQQKIEEYKIRVDRDYWEYTEVLLDNYFPETAIVTADIPERILNQKWDWNYSKIIDTEQESHGKQIEIQQRVLTELNI